MKDYVEIVRRGNMIDLKKIKKQVKDVIEYSQGIHDAKTDVLVDRWYEAKKDFIDAFGGELIYSTKDQVTIHLAEKEREKKIREFCNQTENTFPNYSDLINFVRRNKRDFFDNILSTPYDEDGYHIPAGIKMSKAFRKFVSDRDDLYFIQTAASRIIQEDQITGYLCLSVHPLDYLSSSETNYNWRSCHSLDGEYRNGNLSYMVDSSTIVCYICGKEDEHLPRFPYSVPWNSKKWRMLLFVSEDWNALFAGRHYPFFSKTAMEEVRSRWIFKAGSKKLRCDWWGYRMDWSQWHDDYLDNHTYKEWDDIDNMYLNEKYIPMRGNLYPIRSLIKDGSHLHFNDLLQSSVYTPYYCWRKEDPNPIHFTIGGKVNCLSCGEVELKSDDELMVCPMCVADTDAIICNCCGAVMRPGEAIWVESEQDYICQNCLENYFITCDRCGEVVHIDTAHFDEEREAYFCDGCLYEITNPSE